MQPLGMLAQDVRQSGILVHTEGGEVDFDLERGWFDLRASFEVILLPTGGAVDANLRGWMFNDKGELFGWSKATPTLHIDPAGLTETWLRLECGQADCTPT